mgnify:CR=1 FL=1
MPLVTVGSVTVEYQLGLVKDGAIQHIAGYLPGDDDSPIPTIFKDLQPGTKVNKSGLNLTAMLSFRTGPCRRSSQTAG